MNYINNLLLILAIEIGYKPVLLLPEKKLALKYYKYVACPGASHHQPTSSPPPHHITTSTTVKRRCSAAGLVSSLNCLKNKLNSHMTGPPRVPSPASRTIYPMTMKEHAHQSDRSIGIHHQARLEIFGDVWGNIELSGVIDCDHLTW